MALDGELNRKVESLSAVPNFSPMSNALALAEEWGLPVIPVKLVPRDGKTVKVPLTSHGLLDASTNIEQITTWWTQWPDAAVGVPTGKRTGIFLLDVDPDGDEWFRENAHRLDCGRTHRTTRGWHLLYKMPEGADVTNSVGKIAKGIDIRGTGGFMVWWPATGGEFVGGIEDIKPAPAWLLQTIADVAKAPVIPLHSDVAGMIGAGQRNDFLSREAYRQRKLGGSIDQIVAVLSAINIARCDPPVEHAEILTIAHGKKGVQSDLKPEQQLTDAPPIQAKPFVWRDPKTIPPRPWLYAKHYMRGMASATAGIGGAGKSTMLLTEAVGAACGFNLLTKEQIPVGPLRVWVHNGEDPPDELERRIAAILIHHGVTDHALGGRLFVTSGREMPILVAEALSDGGKVFVPREDGVQLRDELLAKKIDIFIADPFITIHRVNENDNGLIDAVMQLIRNIAHQTQCAFEVAHHLRKLNGGDVGIDDIRGAGSIVGACRSVRLMAAMTAEEAQRYGVEEKDRKAFSWLVNGKANMLPPGHAREWVHTVGVPLNNAAAPYEEDNIGVLEQWIPPESFLDLSPQEYHLIRKAVQEGGNDTLRYSSQASGWVGKLIAAVLGKDINEKSVRSEMVGLIERWKKAGKLKIEEIHSGRQGRTLAIVRWVDSSIEAE